ncbi:MAG: YafY family transcriptional regulator [Bacteroidetes bacterium]|nr:MAG: YafY family transcriptional regulator [Bacteroidota bacterium]
MTRSDRLRGLVHTLQTRRWLRAADLAEHFGVSRRTVYRDVQALYDAGIPIIAVPGKGYRLDDAYVLPPLLLTLDEAEVVLLGTAGLADAADEPLRAAARSVREKVTAALPAEQRDALTHRTAGLRFVPIHTTASPGEGAHLSVLRRAVEAGRAVRLTYRDRGAVATTCTVHPYGLIQQGGAWHLIGRDPTRQRVRSFRLAWTDEVAVLEDRFERPAGYRSALPDGPAPVTVQVLFDPDVADRVRVAPAFHPAETTPHPDGLLVTLKVLHEDAAIPWLLSWGAHVRVLEPAGLRRRLVREAARIIARYRAEPTLL